MSGGRAVIALLGTLAVAIPTFVAVALPAVGLFLTVADRLEPSDAIFVLEGDTPVRELEAAALYHRGLAPRIVLTLARDQVPEVARRLAGEPAPQERAAQVLRRVGVPAQAIVRSLRVVDNTAEELRADFDLARSQGFRRVILVTSPYHTRRVRVIWRARYARALPAVVYPTSYERYSPERWWQSRRYLEATGHEIFGIANFYLGSPLRTFDPEERSLTD